MLLNHIQNISCRKFVLCTLSKKARCAWTQSCHMRICPLNRLFASEMHPHYFIRISAVNRGNSSLWLICFSVQFMSNGEVDCLCSISFLEMIYLAIKIEIFCVHISLFCFPNCYVCVVYYLLFKDTFSICFPLLSSKMKIITAIVFRKCCVCRGISIFLPASRNYDDQSR